MSLLDAQFSAMTINGAARPAAAQRIRKPFIDESPEDADRRLFVRNVPLCFDEVDLYRMFEPYGIVNDIRLPLPTNEAQRARFAFITYAKKSMREEARMALDQQMTIKHANVDIKLDMPLRVEVYIPRSNLPSKGRSPFKEVRENHEILPTSAPPKPLLDFEYQEQNLDTGKDHQPASGFFANPSVRPPIRRKFSPKPRRRPIAKPLDGITRAQLSTTEYQEIVLTHYNDPDDFYVRLVQCHGDYQAMLMLLALEYDDGEHPNEEIITGYLVAVHCQRPNAHDDDNEEAKWRRAYVTAVAKDLETKQSTYYCHLVDTGEKIQVTNHDRIHKLANQFANLPFQAIHCAVGGVRASADIEGEEASSVRTGEYGAWNEYLSKRCLDFLSNERVKLCSKAVEVRSPYAPAATVGFQSLNGGVDSLLHRRTIALFKIHDPFEDDNLVDALLDVCSDEVAKYDSALPAEEDPLYRLAPCYRKVRASNWHTSAAMLAIRQVVSKAQMKPAEHVLERMRSLDLLKAAA